MEVVTQQNKGQQKQQQSPGNLTGEVVANLGGDVSALLSWLRPTLLKYFTLNIYQHHGTHGAEIYLQILIVL